MLFLLVTPNMLLLGALLAIISNTCFGASFVLLNSFLPVLVRYHPSLQIATSPFSAARAAALNEVDHADLLEEDALPDQPHSVTASASLLPDHSFDGAREEVEAYHTEPPSEIQISTKISSYGIGIGYIAAVTVQIISVVIIQVTSGTLWSLRVVLFFIGLWWFVFTFPAAAWLRPRPGPPLHLDSSVKSSQVWRVYLTHSWKSLGKTIAQARRLKDVLMFLAAWFLLSDGKLHSIPLIPNQLYRPVALHIHHIKIRRKFQTNFSLSTEELPAKQR